MQGGQFQSTVSNTNGSKKSNVQKGSFNENCRCGFVHDSEGRCSAACSKCSKKVTSFFKQGIRLRMYKSKNKFVKRNDRNLNR